ncbi:hypothetical protein HPT29_003075 [Microvirga terrae]|uniref:DUF2147 domain-containing protein n=1 Tax=Microvirga terrae TaxID=2740529 RepID=A0ABY5RV01_9HYPH|nr:MULTISPECIES: hypothetical protein [Microvirga]MBQ0822580.1 hypothetical protein [Microvirga sp. HBU67558]UVF20151.1 hypothetical protein HPT29_003075 [Microvirga terrae]
MPRKIIVSGLCVFACGLWSGAVRAQDCSAQAVYFNGDIVETEGDMTVRSGKGCTFNLNGIRGAISETVISLKPKVGKAGVTNLKPYYLSKPGYQGPDEFAYTFVGMNQYGGPMRVTVRRKVVVVP